MERRSQALFVSGIVSVALAPVGLVVATFAWGSKSKCEFDAEHDANVAAMGGRSTPDSTRANCDAYNGAMYGGLAASAVLLGGGLTMLLVGVQKVQVEARSTTATIRPWFSTTTAGLGLQLTL